MIRKIISFICLLSIFIESVPVNALSYGISDIISQETTQSNSNNDTVDEKSDSDKTANLNDDNEKSDSKDNAKEVISNLEDNTFNAYIDGENELAFSIGFDKKESKFIVKKQSEKQLAKDKLDTIIYKISVYDKESNEKLNVELLGSDTGNTEKLNILNETKYEIGDTIKITPLDSKNGLKILGDIQGDIDKNKEDYSDGVDNLDYIYNVRFEIRENNLKTVYNEAPVFEGLTDLLNVEDPNVDVLQGVKVTDDHDGEIDKSKVVVAVQEKTETSAILTYTVEDSWGRITSATRNISAKGKVNSVNLSENGNASKTTQTNSIASNTITVEGVPYHGDITERFKIKFDTASKSIKIIDEDGRVLSNTEKGEYFKVVLYDKYMVEKTSVTLLGTDKSDSEKLEAINNHIFEDGDYIGIWHAESDTKLKIGGTVKGTNTQNGEANPNGTNLSYVNGLPKREISERRFRIKNTGLEEVNNDAPVIGDLEAIEIPRGTEIDLLKDVKGKITDDFDTFDDNSIENGDVSITHSPFDNAKVGDQIITYTATDKWGRSSTKERTVKVTSANPLDYTYIEFMNPSKDNESLFKIKIDPVKKQLVVDNLDNLEDRVIDQSKTSSIFKLKVYTKDGILQKTLNIKGTDKLKTVLRRINGYQYGKNDRIELWSTTPKNIRVVGPLKENINGSEQDYVANESTTNGVNNSNYKEDYSNGINDDDYMKNVRFEIGDSNLKHIYNKAPEFHITTELTTQRNGYVKYMEGISASDDYDSVEELGQNITYTPIDTSTIGEKYIEYKVVDSWGRSTFIKRKVIVYPYNNLEYNYITIKNNQTNKPILSIRFDDKTKKFKIDKLDVSKIPSSLESDDELLEIKLIKKNRHRLFRTGDSVETITIIKQDLIDNNLENKFRDIEYKHGDYLSFNSYDYAKGLHISSKSRIVLGGFKSEDQMVNSRFEIKPEGLEMIYNEEPEIHGLEDILYLYRGEQLTKEKALIRISAEDDLDDKITDIKVKYNGNENLDTVDTNEIGNIELTYEVTDSWGRTTFGQRTVSVISKSVSNDIEFYNTSGDSKLFSLKYNPISHEFDVTKNVKNTDTNEGSSESSTEQSPGNPATPPDTGSEQPPESESTPPKTVVFRLNVFNKTGEEVGKLELSEEDISNNESFNKLNNISVYDDYYFSVWSNTSSRIKIKGDIDGDNTLGESGNQSEDYAYGISNDDHMNNVRFKLRTDGLEAVYNKAPNLTFSKKKLTVLKGDSVDYMEGVMISDDHDNKVLTSENIKITNEVPKGEGQKIGDYNVTYTVTDTWGKSKAFIRTVTVENALKENYIEIDGLVDSTNDKSDRKPTVKLKFDVSNPNDKRIRLEDRRNLVFNTGQNISYITIKLIRKNPTAERQNITVRLNTNDSGSSGKLDVLDNVAFEYGDYFEFWSHHAERIRFFGSVRNPREDYTDGCQLATNLYQSKFVMSEEGLTSVYTDTDINEASKFNIISPAAPEGFPIEYKVDPETKKITIRRTNGKQFLTEVGRELAFKMELYSPNTTEPKASVTMNGNTTPKNEQSSPFKNQDFEYGDFIRLWHIEPNNMIIRGNIKDNRENYSVGISDKYHMDNVVFELTQEGLKAVYNEAPKIEGIDPVDVYQNEEFDETSGVKYSDDRDSNDQLRITPPNNVDTTTLGEKTVTYRVTDTWGNTTEVQRKVTVRPNLYKNVFKVFSDNNQETSIFEVGFDSISNKYRVFNQTSERISSNNLSETAFYIQIIGQNKQQKANITLTGNDRGNAPELSKLNDISYETGDIIRVYRSTLDGIRIDGTVTGDIPNQDMELTEDDKFNYMRNTGFNVSNAGLEAIYNNEPQLIGNIDNKTVSKGVTINFLEGLDVNDDHDTELSTNNISIYVNNTLLENNGSYTFDKIGTYDIQYWLEDSWGRTIVRVQTITVESKVRDNEIQVYGPSNNLAFKITFNTTENKFVLKGNETSTTYNSENSQDKYFEMIVRNIKGEEQFTVTLNGNIEHDKEQLRKIHNVSFNKYDTISLYGKTADAVKIMGGIKQEANSKVNNNYENGFGEVSRYPLVRFKITDDGLKEMTEKEMLISGLTDKSVKRGDEIDYISGILVNVQDNNNEDYKIIVNEQDKSNVNNLKEGRYNVRYTISNSWGTEKNQSITITVEPKNELEKAKLNVKNKRGEVILTIGFDSIQRKLRVLYFKENSTIDSNNGNLAFAINVYDSHGNAMDTIELKGTDIVSDDIINRLNDLTYIEGFRLSIWANNQNEHLDLEGTIKLGNKKTEEALRDTKIDDVNKMENGRFEILNDGLTYFYNYAPTINGGDNELVYYKGSLLTLPEDISVEDDYDTISVNQVTINDDNVDYDILGVQDITYMVEDTWGRVTEKTAKIHVMSSIDKNEMDIFATSSQPNTQLKAFGIGFVKEDGKYKIKIQNQTSDIFNSSANASTTFMNIKIHDKNGKLKDEFKLLSGENSQNSIGINGEGEKKGLNNYVFESNEYISIEGITEETKKCVKINGTVVNQKENYADGVDNIDYIQNVRFKLTDLGLESVYNEEPKITIDETVKIDSIKGDDIPYMRGVKLKDDHDKLTKDNVEVTFNPTPKTTTGTDEEQYNDVIKGVAVVGENILQYKVTDSWGRSVETTRTVNLTNGILNNVIIFNQSVTGHKVMDISFKESEESNKVNLIFNDTGKPFADKYNKQYYGIRVYKPNNSGYNRAHNISLIGTDIGSTNKLNPLKNDKFPYGTIFEFEAFHPDNLMINGPVRNAREDYTDGAQNPENISKVVFKITNSGLKSIYVEKDTILENENIISVLSKESVPLKFKIDPRSKTINVYKTTDIELYHGLDGNPDVFKMTLKGSNGETKSEVTAKSNYRGWDKIFKDTFNNRDYEIGDTLTIWHHTPSRIAINGPIEGAREDYSNGVDNSKNLTEAVFILTANGLEAVYKEAPKIVGVRDTKVLKGGTLNLRDLVQDIKATDSIDGTITQNVSVDYSSLVGEQSNNASGVFVIGKNGLSNGENVPPDNESTDTSPPPIDAETIEVPNKVGVYEVQYSVTNSNERTTRKSSTVVVYDNPTITESDRSRIELNSVKNTDEAIKERLKEAVVVNDEDDNLYKKDTKLEVLSHDVKPNTEGIYKAQYKATDMYGTETTKQITISVSRTINVSVPTTIPFQVVTNLKNKEEDPFISGVMKVQNNNTSDVDVYIQSFTRQESTTTKNGSYKRLEIVEPTSFTKWDDLSQADSMTKMALGIYNKNGLTVDSNLKLTKEKPLWLKENMSSVKLGSLNRATEIGKPYVSKLSFTSKHGKNFKGGTSRGKFNLVFRFE